MTPLKLGQKNWALPTKQEVRKKSIIDLYKKLYKRNSIPEDKQYWTLAGDCVRNGELIEGTELSQVTDSGLMTLDQVHSAELSLEIHYSNSQLKDVTWYNKELSLAIRNAVSNKNFNPAIINYDSTNFLDNKGDLYSSFDMIFGFIEYLKIDNVMFIFNAVIDNLYNKHFDYDKLHIELVKNNKNLQKYLQKDNWNVYPEAFIYRGEKSVAVMGSSIFYKK